LQKNIIICIDR